MGEAFSCASEDLSFPRLAPVPPWGTVDGFPEVGRVGGGEFFLPRVHIEFRAAQEGNPPVTAAPMQQRLAVGVQCQTWIGPLQPLLAGVQGDKEGCFLYYIQRIQVLPRLEVDLAGLSPGFSAKTVRSF